MAPNQWDFIYPEKGVFVHTNHFISERLKLLDINVIQYPDTLLRYGRAKQKLMERAGSGTGACPNGRLDHHELDPEGSAYCSWTPLSK